MDHIQEMYIMSLLVVEFVCVHPDVSAGVALMIESASGRALFGNLSLPRSRDLIPLSIPGYALYSANGATDP